MDVDAKVQEILDRSGQKGIAVDPQVWESTKTAIQSELDALSDQLAVIAGHPVKPSSRKQMAEILFDEIGLPETEKRSVSKEALAFYSHAILPPYFEWGTARRTLSLMQSSEQFWTNGPRIQSKWKVVGNLTSGRVYCSEANLQQLPIRARYALVPDPGKVAIFWDYKHFELRVLAALSGSEALREVVAGDPHTRVVAQMKGKAEDQVTPEERNFGKVLNYGIIYGMEASGLAKRLGIDEADAKARIKEYFNALPGVEEYLVGVIQSARQKGFVETGALHRRRHLGDDWTKEAGKKARQACNTVVQGTAADLLKLTIISLEKNPEVEILATVHDSILCQVDSERVESAVDFIKANMQFGWKGVQFPLELSTGTSWGEAQDALKGGTDEVLEDA